MKIFNKNSSQYFNKNLKIYKINYILKMFKKLNLNNN